MSNPQVSTLAGMRLAGQSPSSQVSTLAGMVLQGPPPPSSQVSTLVGMIMQGPEPDPNPPVHLSTLAGYVLRGSQGDARVAGVVGMKLQSLKDKVIPEAHNGLLQIRCY